MYGINSVRLLNNSDKLLQVFPELEVIVEKVKDSVSKSTKCIPCAKKKHARRIMVALFRVKYDDRDLSLLKEFVSDEGIKNIEGNK